MKRREFVLGGAALAYPWPVFRRTRPDLPLAVDLLPAFSGDLAGQESELGYRRALDRLPLQRPALNRFIIVPSATVFERVPLSSLVLEARQGACVIIDLADGYASRVEASRTRNMLLRDLGVGISTPLAYDRNEYIAYRWPLPSMVRHFSRISYLEPCGITPIAHLRSHIVAARKEIGLGGLIVMGSALGPILFAGDDEAHGILEGFLKGHRA